MRRYDRSTDGIERGTVREIGKKSDNKRNKRICKGEAVPGGGINWKNIMCRTAIILLAIYAWSLNTGNLLEVEAANETADRKGRISKAEISRDPFIDVWERAGEPGGASTSAGQARVIESGRIAANKNQILLADAEITSEAEDQTLADVSPQETYFDGWVQDDAGLLTPDEENALESECRRLFKIYGTGVYIVTTPNFGGGDIKDWQRRIFTQYELGADCDGSGVMLAISMAERDWGLVGFGSAQGAFSTYARERLGELILDDLSDGEFYEAFSGYLSIAEDYLAAAEEGKPYTEQHRYREGWRFPVIFGVSFLLSLGISAAVVIAWKKGMNTRVRQNDAMEYLKAGSFYLSNKSDLFLYHTVSRTKKPEQHSSGGSGSMRSDSSGTSGKF